MFRRNKSDSTSTADDVVDKIGGKGRPTPTRREAEALAKAKARAPRTRKEQMQRERQVKSESSSKIRSAMKSGDERYLLPRDKGPVRRFIRDFVDSRFSIVELLIPLLLVTLVLGYSGSERLRAISSTLILATMLVTLFDILMMRRRLSKELDRRFPDGDTKGTTYYAITRSMQMRFMRLPKTKVKVGQELPEHYR